VSTSNRNNTVQVHILEKDYQIACPPEQQAALLNAARYLDEQMRTIRSTGKVIGLERIAVMAALNITHQFLDVGEKKVDEVDSESEEKLRRISHRLEDALQRYKQMEIT
jgi:cell division protein ZapA